MFLNSAMSEGLAGMQQSYKRMQQAADQIVKAGLPTDNSVKNVDSADAATITNFGSTVEDLPSTSTVNATRASEDVGSFSYAPGDIVEPMVDMIEGQLMFDASAFVVKTDNQVIGTLIDDIS